MIDEALNTKKVLFKTKKKSFKTKEAIKMLKLKPSKMF